MSFSDAPRITHRVSHFIRCYRRIFIVLGCLLIFSAGVWTGRSARVKRLTALVRSYMDVSRHDITIQVAPGIQHRQIKQGVLINILELAPDAVVIRPYRALDAGIGTESIISLARRYNALIAINGGYFEMAGTFRGESVGALKIGGEWISEPEQKRAAIGLSMISGRVEALIDRIELQIELVLQGDKTLAIDGLNRARIENELILYRPIFHAVTLTDLDGVEVLVRDNHVVDIRDGQGSSRIPDDGYVLSANASKRDWLVAHLSVGDKICIRETVIPQHIETQKQWQAIEHIISGGPLLLRGGVPTSSEDHDAEGFDRVFHDWWHPRTAAGVKADGTLILVTITAKNPKAKWGVKLSKLTEFLLEWGARDALNLDGGDSTMMVINGEVVSKRLPSPHKKKTVQGNRRIQPLPSDVGRPIADALVIFRQQ